jgi:hypothetical protein
MGEEVVSETRKIIKDILMSKAENTPNPLSNSEVYNKFLENQSKIAKLIRDERDDRSIQESKTPLHFKFLKFLKGK